MLKLQLMHYTVGVVKKSVKCVEIKIIKSTNAILASMQRERSFLKKEQPKGLDFRKVKGTLCNQGLQLRCQQQPKQIDQVLKLLPQLSRTISQLNIDDELDYSFKDDMFYLCVKTETMLKLIRDNNCIAIFCEKFYLIHDLHTSTLKGIGKEKGGLYYMLDMLISALNPKILRLCEELHSRIGSITHPQSNMNNLCYSVGNDTNAFRIWYHRLRHEPLSRLKHIAQISDKVNKTDDVCLTCPLAKFTKLPFGLREHTAANAFNLIHMDVWGPYRVPTRGKFRYFLTIVDDYTKSTWTFLLQYKSQSLAKVCIISSNSISSSCEIDTIRQCLGISFTDLYTILCIQKHNASNILCR
ncbi:hypothetical protein Cgig2_000031 [Carnegiea gigantea]|uniref:Integrase catalytic domain-containing protein n=1 Tax=Carnegiea gigantea TaxID=171969 RepID=A0A9Q1QS31_9CARY|nr:hypothetical protein Cgig2_000031 [Carnegiea gigantea]